MQTPYFNSSDSFQTIDDIISFYSKSRQEEESLPSSGPALPNKKASAASLSNDKPAKPRTKA